MNGNFLEIAVLILLVCKIVSGYRKGMVKEIISFISLIFLCLVAALLGTGIESYLHGEILTVAVMVFLLSLLGVAHHFLNLAVIPAELIVKLPLVHSADKLLGAVVGVLETILLLWTLYAFIMLFDAGMAGQYILQSASENVVLTWLFEHNYLAFGVQTLTDRIGF